MTESPIPPPPRPDGTPRMKASRVEALRAAAKVHEGEGRDSRTLDLHGVCDHVLRTAERYELWLLERDT